MYLTIFGLSFFAAFLTPFDLRQAWSTIKYNN